MKSTLLRSVGYEEHRQTLEVEFSDGDVYAYQGVPSHVHRSLLAAKSIGGYFNKEIRLSYMFSQVS